MDLNVSEYKTTLDQGNAYWMARISDEAYTKTSETNQKPSETKILQNLKSRDPDFISVTGFDNNSAQSAIVEHEKYLCMVFRGTNEAADWLDNVNALTTERLFGSFHKGFYNSVNDVWQPMFDRYRALYRKNRKPLFLTGHSLGGAMATIAAAKLLHADTPFTSVYTFGQPRAVTLETSRTFNIACGSRFFRFQNNNDIVTRIPARIMGYSHVGKYLYISEEKTIHDDPGFWFRFIDRIDGALNAITEKGLDGVTDHDIKKYMNAIQKWDTDFS